MSAERMDFEKKDPNHSSSACGHDNCMLCRVFGRVHSWKNSGQVLLGIFYEKGQDGARFLIQEITHRYQQCEQRMMTSYTANSLPADAGASCKYPLGGIKRFFLFWTALLLLFYFPKLIIFAFIIDLILSVLLPLFHRLEEHQQCVQETLKHRSEHCSFDPNEHPTEPATRPASPVTFAADLSPPAEVVIYADSESQMSPSGRNSAPCGYSSISEYPPAAAPPRPHT